jgi:hypothetical protein
MRKSCCAGLLTPHGGKIKDRVAERSGWILRFRLEFTALPSRLLTFAIISILEFGSSATPLRGGFCLHPVRADDAEGSTALTVDTESPKVERNGESSSIFDQILSRGRKWNAI